MNFDFLRFIFAGDDNATPHSVDTDTPSTVINPSTGLPMVDNGMGGVDVGGSPFGMDTDSYMSDSFTDDMGFNPLD